VTYAVAHTGTLSVDTVWYDDGTGALQRVVALPVNWSTSVTVANGGSYEIYADFYSAAPAKGSMFLRVQWYPVGHPERLGADSTGPINFDLTGALGGQYGFSRRVFTASGPVVP
jgi:hypothetical protein